VSFILEAESVVYHCLVIYCGSQLYWHKGSYDDIELIAIIACFCFFMAGWSRNSIHGRWLSSPQTTSKLQGAYQCWENGDQIWQDGV